VTTTPERTRPNLVATGVGAGVFVLTAWLAGKPAIDRREEALMRRINAGPEHLHLPISAAMQLGSLGGPWGVAAWLWFKGEHRTAVSTAVAGTATWGLGKLAKNHIGRGRPSDHLERIVIRGQAQTGLGFPSGHAAVSACAACVAAPALPRPLRLALGGGAVVTTLARVYVGAHLPLDVFGGAGMGVAIGCTARAFSGR
jgi:membrane-associated phospholipid phosphatase